jgi:hypothetical protein
MLRLQFPKKLDIQTITHGECVHWDLWGPASVKSLNGNSYVVVQMDNHTCEGQLYFQPNKSDIYKSYVRDEALIETHSRNKIKF